MVAHFRPFYQDLVDAVSEEFLGREIDCYRQYESWQKPKEKLFNSFSEIVICKYAIIHREKPPLSFYMLD